MGSDSVDSPALMRFSRPAHQQVVADFCMDLREVTAGEYAVCSEKGECKRAFHDAFWPIGKTEKQKAWEEARATYSVLCNDDQPGRENHPANCVTWEQADQYCRKHGKRLPREAFRGVASLFFVYGLPAVIASNIPASALLHGFNLTHALWLALAIFVFNRGLKRYSSASS